MPVLAPVPHTTHVVLRAAVLDFKESEHRRRPPATLHVGMPARHEVSFATEPGMVPDGALAADVAAALLQRWHRETAARTDTPPVPLAWLTRAGSLDVHDADVVWSLGTRSAYAEAGLVATFVVVTRQGWADPVSGVRHEWRRLRRRSGSPAPRTGAQSPQV